jgi:hypothetical protein
MKKNQTLISIFILVCVLVITPGRSVGAVGNQLYVATDGNDSGNNCLTQATPCKTIIHAVGQASSGDIINIAAGTYKEANQINVGKDLTFTGAGMNNTIIDGDNSHRVFKINASNAVTMEMLTIRNGQATSTAGGGINNEGTLTLKKVKIANNTAPGSGGGLYVYSGSAALTDSAIIKNEADSGAGIFGREGDITLNRVEISENIATSSTGGIHYQASGGTLSLTNVTLSGNTGNTIGGLATTTGTTTNILNSTIVDNHIDATKTYGGISSYGTLTIESSIVANNDKTQCNVSNPTDWVSNGYNIASDASCDLDGTNDFPDDIVTYGPLGDYGGYSRTHYLPGGSKALENGNNASCPALDQRGIPRPQDFNANFDPGCDMGAFEATDAPQVYSITLEDSSPTSASTVKFKVIFSEPVKNVTADDFQLVKTGSITGFSITAVDNIVGSLYLVTVNTGKYNGTLKLNVKDGTDIEDDEPATVPKILSSGFTTGQVYTVEKIYTKTLKSQGKYDGWVLESGEFTGIGGTKNNTNTTLLLGDNAQNKQYRVILSFGTSKLPDNAVISQVILKVKKAGVSGLNPMKTHNGLVVDIKKNKFYTLPSLQVNDFQAKANKNKVGEFFRKLYAGWHKAVLNTGAYPYINLKGRTQLRLRFLLDDNNDNGADILKLYSGNAIKANRPKLIVKYYIP